MKQPIKDLKTEHEAVKTTLQILDTICSEAKKTDKISQPNHLDQLFEFFQTFVDKCHHGKEEEYLFPALEETGVNKENGPIGVLLKEHQQGRDLVIKMKNALTQYSQGNQETVSDLVQFARDYTKMLVQHIDKENDVLFPIAEKNLSSEKQAILWDGFESIESEKVGAGKHEAFHEMIKSLKTVYIG